MEKTDVKQRWWWWWWWIINIPVSVLFYHDTTAQTFHQNLPSLHQDDDAAEHTEIDQKHRASESLPPWFQTVAAILRLDGPPATNTPTARPEEHTEEHGESTGAYHPSRNFRSADKHLLANTSNCNSLCQQSPFLLFCCTRYLEFFTLFFAYFFFFILILVCSQKLIYFLLKFFLNTGPVTWKNYPNLLVNLNLDEKRSSMASKEVETDSKIKLKTRMPDFTGHNYCN